jgi:hypothetical protein
MNAKTAKIIRNKFIDRNSENYRIYLPRKTRSNDQVLMPIILDPVCTRSKYQQTKKVFKLI